MYTQERCADVRWVRESCVLTDQNLRRGEKQRLACWHLSVVKLPPAILLLEPSEGQTHLSLISR